MRTIQRVIKRTSYLVGSMLGIAAVDQAQKEIFPNSGFDIGIVSPKKAFAVGGDDGDDGDGDGDGGDDGDGDVDGPGGNDLATGQMACGNVPNTGGGGQGGGGGGNGGSSTPFIYTWNGTAFEMENDVMFGSPSSMFRDIEVGRKSYEAGNVTGDMYLIQNKVIAEGNTVRFQIRELEPEESFVDFVRIEAALVPAGRTAVPDGKDSNLYLFDTNDLITGRGAEMLEITTPRATGKLVSNMALLTEGVAAEGEDFKTNEEMVIRAKVTGEEAHLVMYARARDWTAGVINELHTDSNTIEVIRKRWQEVLNMEGISQKFANATLLSAALVFFGVAALIGLKGDSTGGKGQTLASILGTLTTMQVEASHVACNGGNSFIVEYDNGSEYVRLGVVQPRYHYATPYSIRIPKEAIIGGEVRLKVKATMRHELVAFNLVASAPEVLKKRIELPLTKAVLARDSRDYAPLLKEQHSGSYMKLEPADIADLEFSIPSSLSVSEGEKLVYLLNISGFYVPLDEHGRKRIGSWIHKLSEEDRKIISTLFPLRDYHKTA